MGKLGREWVQACQLFRKMGTVLGSEGLDKREEFSFFLAYQRGQTTSSFPAEWYTIGIDLDLRPESRQQGRSNL